MESLTSMLIVSPEVDLIFCNNDMYIVRFKGVPSKKGIPADQIAEMADKLMRNAILSSNEIRQVYGTKEYWEFYKKHIAPSMVQRDPSPKLTVIKPAKSKRKDRTLFKSIVLLFLLLLPNGLFFWSLLFKMLGSGI